MKIFLGFIFAPLLLIMLYAFFLGAKVLEIPVLVILAFSYANIICIGVPLYIHAKKNNTLNWRFLLPLTFIAGCFEGLFFAYKSTEELITYTPHSIFNVLIMPLYFGVNAIILSVVLLSLLDLIITQE